MIVLVYGKDAFRVERRRSDLLWAFRRKYPDGEIVTIHADERELSLPSNIAAAASVDLFSSPRLVDVRGACVLSDDIQKSVVSAVKGLTGSASVLFSESTAPAAKHPLFAYLKKNAGTAESFDPLSPSAAMDFVATEGRISAPAVSFSHAALEKLVSGCGTDSARLSSEAAKIALYVGTGDVSVSDVDLFVRENPQQKVFDALDALMIGNRSRALDILLHESRADSGGVQKLFGLLAWQLRELFKVRGEYDTGNIRADDIARATGMKPYTVGRLISKMSLFPLSRLKSGLSLLADLDADMKNGRMDPELALIFFVERL